MKPMKKLQVMMFTLLLVLLCSISAAAAQRGLVEEADGTYFYYRGTPVTNTWKTVDNKTYYFNAKGKAVSGAQKIGGKCYLFTKNCTLQKPAKDRFLTVDGKRYYVYKTGEIRTDWFKKGSYIYYGNPSARGAIVTGKKFQGINLNGNGQALKNTDAGKLKYKAFAIIDKITKPSQTKAAKIKACWTYVTKTIGFKYYSPYNPLPSQFGKGFQYYRGLQTIDTHRGTCTGISSAFAALVDALGCKVKLVRGKDFHGNGTYDKHTWVEVDGLVYDPYKGWKGRSGYYATTVYGNKYEILKRYNYRTYV